MDEKASNIKVRFPPSPTGGLHLGGARTALFNWLFARKNGGIFLFRIEDSDKERSKPEYEENIIEALNWLGLNWDEGLGKEKEGEKYRQSERTDSYKKYLERLLDEKKAYYCYCSKEDLEAQKQLAIAEGRPPKYSGQCRDLTEAPSGKRPEVIRFKTPEIEIEFKDLIRGLVKFDMSLAGDFVIARSLSETPLYNFAVMIDDFEMGITHVIRGEDHISNTPKQIVMQQAFGIPTPVYAHLPLVLNADRSKLSKRYADVSTLSYRDQGYLPQALINYLVLLGWHPADDREIFTIEELVKEFDIKRVQKGGAIWSEEKLDWINREHMKKLADEELEVLLQPFLSSAAKAASPELRRVALIAVRERMHTLKDFTDLAEIFFALPDYPAEMLIWKKGDKAEAQKVLSELSPLFQSLASYDAPAILSHLESLTVTYGKGNVLWPLRVALSGREASPDPYVIAAALGKEEVLNRILTAQNKLIA